MQFSVRVIKLVGSLPAGKAGDVIGRQLLKSGTSIGANYREAIRASSRRQFVTTMEIAEREASETLYWIDLLSAAALMKPHRLTLIRKECNELIAILTATCRTAKLHSKPSSLQIQNPKPEIRHPVPVDRDQPND